MIRIHLPAELFFAIGLLLTFPSAFGWLIAAQAGNATWIALTITGFVAGISLLRVAARRA